MDITKRVKEKIPSKVSTRPMGPIQPSDYDIIEFLIEREGFVKGTVITDNVSLSQSQVYKRCNELVDRGILENKNGAGYKIVIGKRYFPVHLVVMGFIIGIIGIGFLLSLPVLFCGLVFSASVMLDWYLNK